MLRSRHTLIAIASLLAVPGLAATQTTTPTVWPDEGPATWAPRATEPAITANDLRTHVYQLAADSMMGRAAATRGNTMATDYIAGVFERLGLQPAGENGYFQEIAFGSLGFDRDSLRLVVDGRSLVPGQDWVPLPPAAQVGIAGDFSGRDIATVFGGEWVDGSTTLSAADMRGRVVLFVVPDAETARQRGIPPVLQLRGSPALPSAAAATSARFFSRGAGCALPSSFNPRPDNAPARARGSASMTRMSPTRTLREGLAAVSRASRRMIATTWASDSSRMSSIS
jgi:hypothetical protein